MPSKESLQPLHQRVGFPTTLKVVIGLFFLHGIVAMMEMVIAYSRGRPSLNMGAISLIIGVGLLLRIPLARWMAIGATFLLAVVILVMAGMAVNGAPAVLDWFGNRTPVGVPGWALAPLGLTGLAALAWQLEILTRQHTSDLFR